VQSYMVPASVDPGTLTFNAAGPVPNTLGAGFRQPLYDATGSPYVDSQTANAATAGGPGPIINIPDFNYGAAFVPGNIPPGAYNLGIACTLGPAGPSQMKEYWNVTKTFTTNAATGGTAEVSWSVGAVPAAPTLSSVTPGDGTLTATFTAVASTPPTTGFTATATGPGGPFTATGASSPITIPGLTNGSSYSVTVRATNSAGDSPESNSLTGTPNPARPPVQNLTAAPGTGSVDLNWDAPTGPVPTGYTVTVDPAEGTVVVDNASTSASITGLAPGTSYTFTVTPTYASPPPGTPATVSATPFSAQVINQEIEVVRPVGALVLTQRCGVYGALDAESAAPVQPGFPNGFAAAPAAGGTTGTAPHTDWDGATGTSTAQDTANFPEYPYPVDEDGPDNDPLTYLDNETPNATYPTHCGVQLGTGKFVTSGPGAGQFFAASGRLNQVTVVDTRDSAPDGWTINGRMENFTVDGGGASFNANHLGWTPKVTDDSDAFDHDLDPGTPDYDQVALAGSSIAPRSTTAGASLGGSGATLARALEGSDLGIAVLDARLKLLIPVTARNGRYTGTLSFTAS